MRLPRPDVAFATSLGAWNTRAFVSFVQQSSVTFVALIVFVRSVAYSGNGLPRVSGKNGAAAMPTR